MEIMSIELVAIGILAIVGLVLLFIINKLRKENDALHIATREVTASNSILRSTNNELVSQAKINKESIDILTNEGVISVDTIGNHEKTIKKLEDEIAELKSVPEQEPLKAGRMVMEKDKISQTKAPEPLDLASSNPNKDEPKERLPKPTSRRGRGKQK